MSNYVGTTAIIGLAEHQQKALLSNTRYFLRDSYPRVWGKIIGWKNISQNQVGAIVAYPNNQRSFFKVDPNTFKIVDAGTPPPRPSH